MAFTKHASLENVQVLELRSSPTKVRHASLGKLADFHQYKTDDGFLYARIRAISSRVNKNNDGWPSVELAGGPDVFDRHLGADGFTVHADSTRHYGFSTFLGKPIFVDHHNSDPQRARGVIVDAKFHVDDHRTSALDPYYSSSEVDPEHLPGTWVELLLEVDAKSFPKFAQAIVEGSRNPNKGIDGWSMGCDVDRSECSICKNSATNPEEYCKHIRMKGAYFDHADPRTGHKTSKRAYENCLTPDTSILLADGRLLAISQVTTGMSVLDHLGEPRRVLDVTSRQVAEEIIEVSRTGQGYDRPLRLTGNHPVLAVRGAGLKKKQVARAKPEFILAGDLCEDDWVVEVAPSHRVTLKNVLTPRVTKYLRQDIPEAIELDEDFGRWCGWYLAEGSISYNRLSSGERSEASVMFALHTDEVAEREEILRLGKRLFGLTGRLETRGNGTTVAFHNRPLALFLSQLGTSSYEKALPHDWLSGPITFINGVVGAHRAGDGHYNPGGERWNEMLHVTSSRVLADQLYDMNIWLGHTPSRRLDKPTVQNKRTVPATHLAYPAVRQRAARNRVSAGDWTLSKISRLARAAYEGPVHNLEIADTHTYIANGQVVHNCYGVRFFEISGVFDPADETALSLERIAKAKAKDPALQDLKEESLLDAAGELNEEYAEDTIEGIKRRKDKKGALHLAENPPPQGDMAHAPEKVDTLREETVCPVCGSSMDEDTCDVCSYQEPPEGFGNPDLTKARDVDVPTEPQNDPRMDAPNVDVNEGHIPQESAPNTNTPSNPALVAHVTGDMAWDVHTRTSGRINKNERPLISSEKPQTNEPSEKIVSDQLRPVTSRVRTAEDFIVAAGATRRNTMNHTADAASGAPAVAKPDVRTDVTGIGGVDQASNDAASKADAQVDVLAIGGTGVESVSAEKEGVEVAQGDEHSKNIEAIPTDTWGPGQGDSLGQQDPVTRQTPSWVNENRWSHWHVEGHEDGDLIAQEQQGGNTWADTGAPAVTGVKPIAEQFGDRVNVKDHLTSPANNSGPTTTWTGTDGNGVLKQQDPVTNESIALSESGLEGKPNWSTSSHIFQAFKLARLEVKLGMLGPDMEFQRAAELERETPERLTASLEYAQRVAKTATRVAGTQRLPVMGRPSAIKEASVDTPSADDSFLFGA